MLHTKVRQARLCGVVEIGIERDTYQTIIRHLVGCSSLQHYLPSKLLRAGIFSTRLARNDCGCHSQKHVCAKTPVLHG